MACNHDHGGAVSGALFPVSWPTRYVGAPFADGGRGPVAFDCWGLVRAIYADQLGHDLPTYGDISSADLIRVARAMAGGQDRWAVVDDPQPFDVALMSSGRGGRAAVHVGVAVDPIRIIHTEKATGAVIVPVEHLSIRGRILGWRRYCA